jgi:hypothetical protein
MVSGVSIQARLAILREAEGSCGLEDGGAAVVNLQPRDYGRNQNSWTQRQGKAGAN